MGPGVDIDKFTDVQPAAARGPSRTLQNKQKDKTKKPSFQSHSENFKPDSEPRPGPGFQVLWKSEGNLQQRELFRMTSLPRIQHSFVFQSIFFLMFKLILSCCFFWLPKMLHVATFRLSSKSDYKLTIGHFRAHSLKKKWNWGLCFFCLCANAISFSYFLN